ncbi:MAG: helix-turn-helix domain-containing protein [Bacilli bacterium]|jgi:DNA-binding PucR family transcriptional regulator|nr:helix-turn-helix domain-containing protein [Bacilli bacterium]
MKSENKSFMIFACNSKEVSSLLKTVLIDSLKQSKTKYEFINKDGEDYILLINKDITDDLKETALSLLQDLDNDISVLEGFRYSDKEQLEGIYKCFKDYNSIGYTKIADIILKLSDEDLKPIKEMLLSKLKDNYLKEIIIGMFKSNLNISKAASVVYMHRNTINNKLDTIQKETGLDIQNFYEAMAMNRILN